MAWPQYAEVTLIKSCQLGFVQPLDDRENGRVHIADVRICVSVAEIGDASIVARRHVDHAIGALVYVRQKRDQHSGMQAALDQVIDFYENRARNQDRLTCLLDQPPTACVVVVAAVERGKERSGVKDQRQGRGSGRSSPARRAVSGLPDDPTPRLRGRGRELATFSSIASRTTVAMDTPRSAASRRSRARRSAGMVRVVRSMMQ